MNTTTGNARIKKTAGDSTPRATPNSTGDATIAAKSTRSNTTVVNDRLQEISGPIAGRRFLEGKLLLVPEGNPLTPSHAATCLNQIIRIDPKISPVVAKAMRSLALMLQEMETVEATQTYHDGFHEEITTFSNEMKSLVGHAQEQLDQKIAQLGVITTTLTKITADKGPTGLPMGIAPRPQLSYSQILSQPVQPIHPKILARHGIRARQVMLEGIAKEDGISTMDDKQAKDKVNKELLELEPTGSIRVRAATRQRNGGLLIEFDSDFGAAWTRTSENLSKLCSKIGNDVCTRKRTYELIALSAPLSAEPDDSEFVKEVEETNKVEEGSITAMRWAKKISRRSPGQRWAHIILTVNNANEANRLIAMGMYIANKKVSVKKCKADPIRCLKCQGYNHFAKECTAKDDTCGHCGQKGHRTTDCTSTVKRCISCNIEGHASYERTCPFFLKKIADKDLSTPENNLPFIPTDEPWTWGTTPPTDVLRSKSTAPTVREKTPQLKAPSGTSKPTSRHSTSWSDIMQEDEDERDVIDREPEKATAPPQTR